MTTKDIWYRKIIQPVKYVTNMRTWFQFPEPVKSQIFNLAQLYTRNYKQLNKARSWKGGPLKEEHTAVPSGQP